MKMQPSAFSMRELEAVSLALKLVSKELRKDINKATRDTLNPVWRGLVSQRATDPLDARILAKGTRIKAGNPTVAVAGSSKRALSDGLVPAQESNAWEFGTPNPGAYTTYSRRHPETGRRHEVRRRTKRQVPRAAKSGRVVHPAFAELAPRMTSLWVQIIVRKIYRAHEGKTG